MTWLARTAASAAVRKVVYVVVGLALAAVLGAVGVKAAVERYQDTDSGFTYGGTVTQGHNYTGTEGTCVLLWNNGGARGTATVTVTGGGTVVIRNTGPDAGTPGSDADVTIDGVAVADAVAGPGSTTYNDVAPGAVFVVLGNQNSGVTCLDWVEYDKSAPAPTPTPTPGATPTPTPEPTPDPICEPHCNVALVQADRDRIDLLQGSMVSGLAVVILLGTAVAVATGLRR